MPFALRASAFVRAASIFALKASNGCAPERRTPLMNMCGVPPAFTALARSWSASMTSLYFPLATASLYLATSTPSSFAAPSRSASSSFGASSKSFLCAAQKPLSPFSARASRARTAAGTARGWKGSG